MAVVQESFRPVDTKGISFTNNNTRITSLVGQLDFTVYGDVVISCSVPKIYKWKFKLLDITYCGPVFGIDEANQKHAGKWIGAEGGSIYYGWYAKLKRFVMNDGSDPNRRDNHGCGRLDPYGHKLQKGEIIEMTLNTYDDSLRFSRTGTGPEVWDKLTTQNYHPIKINRSKIGFRMFVCLYGYDDSVQLLSFSCSDELKQNENQQLRQQVESLKIQVDKLLNDQHVYLTKIAELEKK
eukprot:374398_1